MHPGRNKDIMAYTKLHCKYSCIHCGFQRLQKIIFASEDTWAPCDKPHSHLASMCWTLPCQRTPSHHLWWWPNPSYQHPAKINQSKDLSSSGKVRIRRTLWHKHYMLLSSYWYSDMDNTFTTRTISPCSVCTATLIFTLWYLHTNDRNSNCSMDILF